MLALPMIGSKVLMLSFYMKGGASVRYQDTALVARIY